MFADCASGEEKLALRTSNNDDDDDDDDYYYYLYCAFSIQYSKAHHSSI